MSSIDQYIDLYGHNRETVEAATPDVINRLRRPALEALKSFGRFPGKRDEGYSRFSVEDLFAPASTSPVYLLPSMSRSRSAAMCPT